MNFFLVGLFGVLSFIFLWAIARTVYFTILKQKKLKPNCLLTKSPLVLFTDPVSPWKFWAREQKIYFRLQEHGYRVLWAQSLNELSRIRTQSTDSEHLHLIENWDSFESEDALLSQVQTWAEQDHLASIR